MDTRTQIAIIALLSLAAIKAVLLIKRRMKEQDIKSQMRLDYAFLLNRLTNYATPETHHIFENEIIQFNNTHTGTPGCYNYFKQLNDALYAKMERMIELNDVLVYQ